MRIPRRELLARYKQFERELTSQAIFTIIALGVLGLAAFTYALLVRGEIRAVYSFHAGGVAVTYLVVVALVMNYLYKRAHVKAKLICPRCKSILSASKITEIALSFQCDKCGQTILEDTDD